MAILKGDVQEIAKKIKLLAFDVDGVMTDGSVTYDENGVEIVNFGKYKGQPVKDVLRKDPSYKNWMLQGDFTLNTKQTLERLALKYAGK